MATYEVDYDQETVDNQTGGNFDLIPEGVYLADIYEVEVKEYADTSAQSGNFLKVTLKIAEEGPYYGRQIWDNCVPLSPVWASGKPAFKFKQFFGSLGLLEDGRLSFDPDDLLGEQIQVAVKITPARTDPETGEAYGAKNEVKRYLSVDEDVPVAVKEPVKATAKPAVKARAAAKPGKL